MARSKGSDSPGAKRVELDTASMPTVFSDITQVNVSGEHALLVFGRKNPEDESKAIGACGVYVTLPHLVRLKELLDRVVADVLRQGAAAKGKNK